jgi:hypothetical protein
LKRLNDEYMQFELIDTDYFKNFDFIKKRIEGIIKGSDSLYYKIRIPRINTESEEVCIILAFYDR